MSSFDLLRGFFALIFSGILVWHVYRRESPEEQDGDRERAAIRYSPVISPVTMLVYILTYILTVLVIGAWDRQSDRIIGLLLNILFSMLVYYAILLPLGPLLRRSLRAKTCALLWLLPSI